MVRGSLRADKLPAARDENVAVLVLIQVDYRSGRIHDLAVLTRQAQASGILIFSRPLPAGPCGAVRIRAGYSPGSRGRGQSRRNAAGAGLAALEVGVDLLLKADLRQVREKSWCLVDLGLRLLDQESAAFGFEPVCPRPRSPLLRLRGAHPWPGCF